MRSTKIILLAAIVCAVMSSAGCATLFRSYGSLVLNDDAQRSFERYEIDPNFYYYISGSSSYPSALMGLNKSYELDDGLWKNLTTTPEGLRILVTNMQSRASTIGMFQYGFAILDDTGQQIGTWYSLRDVKTYVKILDNHKVQINTPSFDTYTRHENGDDAGGKDD